MQSRACTPRAAGPATAGEADVCRIINTPSDPAGPANRLVRCDGRTGVLLNRSAAHVKAATGTVAARAAGRRETGVPGVAASAASAAWSTDTAAECPRCTETTRAAISTIAARPGIAPVAACSADCEIVREAAPLIQLEQTTGGHIDAAAAPPSACTTRAGIAARVAVAAIPAGPAWYSGRASRGQSTGPAVTAMTSGTAGGDVVFDHARTVKLNVGAAQEDPTASAVAARPGDATVAGTILSV
jgi:hypothetical protein